MGFICTGRHWKWNRKNIVEWHARKQRPSDFWISFYPNGIWCCYVCTQKCFYVAPFKEKRMVQNSLKEHLKMSENFLKKQMRLKNVAWKYSTQMRMMKEEIMKLFLNCITWNKNLREQKPTKWDIVENKLVLHFMHNNTQLWKKINKEWLVYVCDIYRFFVSCKWIFAIAKECTRYAWKYIDRKMALVQVRNMYIFCNFTLNTFSIF